MNYRKSSLLTFLLILVITLSLFNIWLGMGSRQKSLSPYYLYPEVKRLEQNSYSFSELSEYFTDLANKKGADYAYEVLKRAPTPPSIDMHLMGHVVGDILYKQRGVEGIKICTDDFRNACSHSIVVGLFTDEGKGALPKITEACKQAPGGKGAYTMCFHGLGHGILAYTEFDLVEAIKTCKDTGEYESVECIGGAVMEIIGGGFHDRKTWTSQRSKYLSVQTPLSLCQESYMPKGAVRMCFIYLTPFLLESVGANLAQPTTDDFEKAFRLCDKIPKEDSVDRNSCYGGFGKEFVVFAKQRDIRNIEKMTTTELQQIIDWCDLGKTEEARDACISFATGSLYWGGENDYQVAIDFCNLTDSTFRAACFEGLTNQVRFYARDKIVFAKFCTAIPSGFQSKCKN